MFDYLPEIVTTVVIIAVFIVLGAAIVFGVDTIATAHDDKLWNGGHCDVCDGAWQYEQAVGHRSSTSYIYVCKDCGKRIELYEAR